MCLDHGHWKIVRRPPTDTAANHGRGRLPHGARPHPRADGAATDHTRRALELAVRHGPREARYGKPTPPTSVIRKLSPDATGAQAHGHVLGDFRSTAQKRRDFGTWARQYTGVAAEPEDRARPRVFVFGRMKPGVAPPQAAAEMNAIAAQIQREQPRSLSKSAPLAAPINVERVRGIPNARSRSASGPIAAVLLAVVGIVLLIACVNVGNLPLARGAVREREISLRIALGARRARVVRQLLTESLMLAAGGGLLGLVLGVWTGRLLEAILPATAFGEALARRLHA